MSLRLVGETRSAVTAVARWCRVISVEEGPSGAMLFHYHAGVELLEEPQRLPWTRLGR